MLGSFSLCKVFPLTFINIHTYIHTYIQLRNRTPRAWQSSSLPAAHQSARPRPTSSRSAGTAMLSLACTSLSCLGHRGERGSPPRAYGSRQRSRQRPTGGSPVLGQAAEDGLKQARKDQSATLAVTFGGLPRCPRSPRLAQKIAQRRQETLGGPQPSKLPPGERENGLRIRSKTRANLSQNGYGNQSERTRTTDSGHD